MTPDEFRRAGHRLVDWIADYRQNLSQRPVGSRVAPGDVRRLFAETPPQTGRPIDQVLDEIDAKVLPGLVHWQHPRYFGWFPSNGLEAGVLGDLLSTGLGVVGLSWQSSPALTEIEEVVCDWARQMFHLPPTFSGVIQDTASASTLVALICARERASGFSLAGAGLQGETQPLTIYASAHSHSSVAKAATLAGFGQANLRLVPDDEGGAMSPAALDETIRADLAAGRTPCAVVATVGTTSVTAFDPLTQIAAVARRHGAWLHVDAAMAGAAMILPETQPLFAGVDQADSLVVNAHKWLGVPFDCSLYFVRDPAHLQRVMSSNPSYLQSDHDDQAVNYRDWGIPLGRRFRALKLWFVLEEQGVDGLRVRLRRDLANAAWLGRQVAAAPGWRLVTPVRLQTVCLRHEPPGLDGEALDRHTRAWAEAVNASGEAWITPAKVGERWLVRISVGALGTERADVEALWATVRRAAEGV